METKGRYDISKFKLQHLIKLVHHESWTSSWSYAFSTWYINSQSEPILLADDTHRSGHFITDHTANLTHNLKQNYIKFGKTNILKSVCNNKTYTKLNISYCKQTTKEVVKTEFLALQFDGNLNWKQKINILHRLFSVLVRHAVPWS